MGKKSKEDKADSGDEDVTMETDGDPQEAKRNTLTGKDEYAEACKFLNPIAKPLASRKLAKKVYKLVRKASKEKGFLRRGLADVQRSVRKGQRGLMILAGDVTPIEIYCHMPGVCESKELPYVFTPSRFHLALASGSKRPAIMLLIVKHDSYVKDFEELEKAMNQLPLPVS